MEHAPESRPGSVVSPDTIHQLIAVSNQQIANVAAALQKGIVQQTKDTRPLVLKPPSTFINLQMLELRRDLYLNEPFSVTSSLHYAQVKSLSATKICDVWRIGKRIVSQAEYRKRVEVGVQTSMGNTALCLDCYGARIVKSMIIHLG